MAIKNDWKKIAGSFWSQPLQVGLFLLFLIIPLLVISGVINERVTLKKGATGGNPSFSFQPAVVTVNPVNEFTVEIKINTAGQQTSGAAVQITYDKDTFEALEIIPGKDLSQVPIMFPAVLRNKIDNPNGKIYLDAGVEVANPQYYVGEGVFGKIKFKVKPEAATGNKTVAFFLNNPSNPAALGDCDIIGSGEKVGQDLLGEVNNLTVTVSSQTTPTNTPVPASPTPSGTQPTSTPGATGTALKRCFDECDRDENCSENLKCSVYLDSKRCLNPNCTSELDCACNICGGLCSLNVECLTGLSCLEIGGQRKCVKAECPSQTDCSCRPTPTTQPSVSPRPSVTLSPAAAADISGPNNRKDGKVNLFDYNALMVHWGETKNISKYDLSGPEEKSDGIVDIYDLSVVLKFWQSQ